MPINHISWKKIKMTINLPEYWLKIGDILNLQWEDEQYYYVWTEWEDWLYISKLPKAITFLTAIAFNS